MPTISGNIGELISFDVESAGAVTGVSFGNGFADYFLAQSNNSTLNARVPESANWGHVTFYKGNVTVVYGAIGTGLHQTGALDDLETNLTASGLLGACTSGSVVYSNLYDASGICTLTATGTAQNLASGKLYNAYNSGLCGSDLEGYTDSGYSTGNTRLDGFNSFVDEDEAWAAVGNVEHTGSFIYQKASLEVECVAPIQESTSYKFVPIPVISNFTPQEGSAGNPLLIYGNVFADVSSVEISGVNVTHQVSGNTLISGTIPAGTFENKIKLTGPSGVKAFSVQDFVSLDGLSVDPEAPKVLSLRDGQTIKRYKGDPDLATILGQNISGLTSGYLTDESNQKIDLLSQADFSYIPAYVRLSVSGLDEGKYGITVQNALYTSSLDDVITILDGPDFNYSYNHVSSSVLINEPETSTSGEGVYLNLANKDYPFSLTGERLNKICLTFQNSGIKEGSVKYQLERDLNNHVTTIATYYTEGPGLTEQESKTKVSNMFNSGIYTRDAYGDLFDSYSYRLNACTCNIISSGTAGQPPSFSEFVCSGLVTGVLEDIDNHPDVSQIKEDCRSDFAEYTGFHSEDFTCIESGFTYTSGIVGHTDRNELELVTSGYTQEVNESNIQQQTPSEYEVTGLEHESGVFNEEYFFESGISHPFLTDLINDHASEPWERILHSGIGQLYPNGYGDDYGFVHYGPLSSGYTVINSSNFPHANTLIITGKNEVAASGVIDVILTTGYSQCRSWEWLPLNGNYSATTINVTGTITGSGIMYGYC